MAPWVYALKHRGVATFDMYLVAPCLVVWHLDGDPKALYCVRERGRDASLLYGSRS